MKNRALRNKEIRRISGLNDQIETILFNVAKGLRGRTLEWKEAKDILLNLSLLDVPYPILRGLLFTNIDYDTFSINVYCPYCKDWHLHGITQDELDITKKFPELKDGVHRVAHCTSPTSPFKQTGYYLQLFTEDDFQMFKNDIRYIT